MDPNQWTRCLLSSSWIWSIGQCCKRLERRDIYFPISLSAGSPWADWLCLSPKGHSSCRCLSFSTRLFLPGFSNHCLLSPLQAFYDTLLSQTLGCWTIPVVSFYPLLSTVNSFFIILLNYLILAKTVTDTQSLANWLFCPEFWLWRKLCKI